MLAVPKLPGCLLNGTVELSYTCLTVSLSRQGSGDTPAVIQLLHVSHTSACYTKYVLWVIVTLQEGG